MGIGISIVLVAVGAVLTFALEREAEGIPRYRRDHLDDRGRRRPCGVDAVLEQSGDTDGTTCN